MSSPRERGLLHRAASLLRRSEVGAEPQVAPPDELVDSFFDRELTPEQSRELFKALRSDSAASDRFNDTQDVLDSLRRPVDSPDFTASILAEVGRRRAWLPLSMRRFVTVGRFAAAACLLVVVAAGFVAQRVAPESVTLAERPQPLTNLVRAGQADAATGLHSIASVIGTFRAGEPAAPCSIKVSTCDKTGPRQFERMFVSRCSKLETEATSHERTTVQLHRVSVAFRPESGVMMKPQSRFYFIEISQLGPGQVLFGARSTDFRTLPEMFGDE